MERIEIRGKIEHREILSDGRTRKFVLSKDGGPLYIWLNPIVRNMVIPDHDGIARRAEIEEGKSRGGLIKVNNRQIEFGRVSVGIPPVTKEEFLAALKVGITLVEPR